MKHQKTQIIVIDNQKGGCAKTTTSMNVAVGLADKDYKVCCLDFDMQNDLSKWLGYEEDKKPTIFEIISQEIANIEMFSIENCIRKSPRYKNISFIPANRMLKNAITTIATSDQPTTILKNILHKDVFNQFDYIVIDCPNGFDLLVTNILMCCDKLIIPVQADYISYEKVNLMLETLMTIKGTEDIEQYIVGILVTLHNKNRNSHKETFTLLKQSYPDMIFDLPVPNHTEVADSVLNGKVSILNPISEAGKSYKAVVQKVINNQNKIN